MRMSRFVVIVTGVLVLGVSGTAHAYDLTGHWVGSWKCSVFDGAKSKSSEKSSMLAITQVDETIAATIDDGSFLYNGQAVTDSAKPDKGEVVLLACPTANTLGGDEAEIVRAAVKTKAGTDKATFRATSIFADDYPEVGTCKYKYKRVDRNDPGLTGCPVL